MASTGGCYCKKIRYEYAGDPIFQGQCHCRECQYISGGAPSLVMAVPEAGFRFTSGEPRSYTRPDLENPATRLFCPDCGTHLLTHSAMMPGAYILKVGTLDDPGQFKPQMAVFTCDSQPYHHIPPGIAAFDRTP